MATPKVPLTITYRHAGTQPPIFLAGEFSDPPWEPQEMDYTTDEDGEHTFKKEVFAAAGSKVQYKFRVGTGDWWVLNDDAPTATDAGGFLNNVTEVPSVAEPSTPAAVAHMAKRIGSSDAPDTPKDNDGSNAPEDSTQEVREAPAVANAAKELMARADPHSGSGASTPSFVKTAAEVADSAALLDKEDTEPEVTDEEAGRTGFRRMSATPIHDVADTAAEVADTAKELDSESIPRLEVRPPEYDDMDPYGFDEPLPSVTKAPLFAHECVGMELYEGDDVPGAPEEEHDRQSPDNEEAHNTGAEYDDEDIDLNDPTLERFPSNREEIIDTVRKLEGGLNEDHSDVEGLIPLSPVVGPSGPQNHDLGGDFLVSSPAVASPVVPRGSRLLSLPRTSLGSVSSDWSSALSLDSISEAEEAAVDEDPDTPPMISTPKPRKHAPDQDVKSPGSDKDDGILMKSGKDKNDKSRKASSSDDSGLTTPGGDKPADAPVDDHEITNSGDAPASSAKPDIKLVPASESSRAQTPEPSGSGPDNGNTEQTAGDIEEIQARSATTDKDKAKATGVDSGAQSQLKRRTGPPERVATPNSINEAGMQAAKSGSWFQSFFHMIFVDWIGGFLRRLFGGKRETLLVAGAAAILAGAAWWKNSSKER